MIATKTEDKALGWSLSVVALTVVCVLLAAGTAGAAAFTVNRTGDAPDANLANAVCDVNASAAGNQCTLRAAIQEANDTDVADTINFNISAASDPGCDSGSGVCTISPSPSELPEITRPVTIDGYTQPGAKPNTLAAGGNAVLRIVLDVPNAGRGLVISAANSTVKGLVINRGGVGVQITGSDATGNRVVGNYVGTSARGEADLGNGDNGVDIVNAASNNTVGGTTPRSRNVISGNDAIGVKIEGTDTINNTVAGNFIGTDADGQTELGNGFGVDINGAPTNTVGGTTAGARNVISGNTGGTGVVISGSDAMNNRIMGNYIGTDASGTQKLRNLVGVRVSSASFNTIGGQVTATSNPSNRISGNSSEGVVMEGADAASNRIQSNSIYGNGGLGMNLSGGTEDSFGVTENDEDDLDTGPNNLQNFPILTSATTDAQDTTIEGTFNSYAQTGFTLQFFGSPAADPSGNGEGKTFKFERDIVTDGTGDFSFTFNTAKKIPEGQVVTATAIRGSLEGFGDTSEFSNAVTVN